MATSIKGFKVDCHHERIIRKPVLKYPKGRKQFILLRGEEFTFIPERYGLGMHGRVLTRERVTRNRPVYKLISHP
jgi:hypothetical protein